MSIQILLGDCRKVMRTLPDASIDAVVTDPPYHLTTGKKGGTGEASVNLESPYGRARVTTGFMGMDWDGGDVAFQPDTWREVLRVLKPGGYLLAFGGSRTYHRLACAIEDAGFEIRDQIMWIYGSGFPKSHNGPWGGTALKPAHEPIVMARKQLNGTVAANFAACGTGALNIQSSLVGGENGRWPANVIHDGSDEVIAAFPNAPGQQNSINGSEPSSKTHGVYGGFKGRAAAAKRLDEGSAARFFYCAKASKADREAGCDGLPTKQGGMVSNTSGQHITPRDGGEPGERANHHPTVKPTELMRYLCRLVTPAGGVVLDPFMGSGSTGRGAALDGLGFIGIELSAEYHAIAESRIAHAVNLRSCAEMIAEDEGRQVDAFGAMA